MTDPTPDAPLTVEANTPCCACLTVEYDPEPCDGEAIWERWRCKSCGSVFVRLRAAPEREPCPDCNDDGVVCTHEGVVIGPCQRCASPAAQPSEGAEPSEAAIEAALAVKPSKTPIGTLNVRNTMRRALRAAYAIDRPAAPSGVLEGPFGIAECREGGAVGVYYEHPDGDDDAFVVTIFDYADFEDDGDEDKAIIAATVHANRVASMLNAALAAALEGGK